MPLPGQKIAVSNLSVAILISRTVHGQNQIVQQNTNRVPNTQLATINRHKIGHTCIDISRDDVV